MIDLHIHTKFSLLDAMSDLEDIIKKTKEMGRNAIAVTEHGNLYSSISMFKLCKKHNIKYIHGCEVYICDNVNIKNKKNKYYHLILLSKNEVGRQNLIKLVSKSSNYKYYGKPRIDFKMLKEHKEGLIVLSSCMAGEVQRALQKNKTELAKDIALQYKKEFGDDYYLEYQSHSEKIQQQLNRKIVDLAKELDIKYVVTTDAHYVNKEDQKYHGLFVKIGQSREVGETYNDCYIQSDDEILEKCKSTTKEENLKAMKNTEEIANQCDVKIPLSPPIIPHVEIPKKHSSEMEYLKHLCVDGWIQRKIHKLPQDQKNKYKKRLQYEAHAIEKMGFEGYYLLVYSYANTVKRRGIARGSGGGSLVAYLMNIVDIDPVKYGLYFERFIDVGALDLLRDGKITKSELKIPDFDLDFGKKDREKVIKYIIEKYGQENVASLGSFQYIWAKGAIKDIGKVLKIPFETTNQITKHLDNETIEEALDLGLLDEYKDKYPRLFEYASKLSGLPKSFSMHPCGKVIAMRSVDYFNATEISDSGEHVIQGDMHDADSVGLVKIDALGLRTVDVIYDTLDMIGKNYDYIAPHNLNFNDRKVWENFANGYTDGIFQFESKGMKSTLKKMKCSSLNDLGAANALFRPGSMAYIDDYVKRKRGEDEVRYIDKDLEPILESTYGIIVFQEQLIEIGRLAKLKNPDKLRKATGKKIQSLMDEVKPELEYGLRNRGWEENEISQLWDDMVQFAKYSFNKSHSYAYAIIAYICMYLKTYHPKEFLVSWMNSCKGKIKKMKICAKEARRLNVQLKIPDLSNMNGLAYVNNNSVVVGTGLVKSLNNYTGDYLKKKQFSDDLINILKEIISNSKINTSQLKTLISLGSFDDYGIRKKIYSYVDYVDRFADAKLVYKKSLKDKWLYDIVKDCGRETDSQFRDLNNEEILNKIWNTIPNEDFNIREKTLIELEYLGYIKTTDKSIHKDFAIVSEINTNRWGTTFLTLYRPNNGAEEQVKIYKKTFAENKVEQFDMIKTVSIKEKHKKRKVDGKWIQLDETEQILSQYAKVVF